jgi:hypothetical protein
MMMSQNQALKTLTTRSSLTVLLRTLYRMGLDYCVLPPGEDFRDIIVFTKDQLVSLIERGSSEASLSDISTIANISNIAKRVAQGLFKPMAIFKSDASSSDLASTGGLGDPEQLQVLVIDDKGAAVSSLKEALTPKGPNLPEWWEAPIPFVLCGDGVFHINRTAMLMFGPDLKRLASGGLPDKNEFLVTLEGGSNPCTVTFRRLEEDIFMLDDCTGDVAAAADIAWWAAVGKAWAAALDREKIAYRRCAEEEAEVLRAENEHTVHPCEWEGELLGYLCVEKKNAKNFPHNVKNSKSFKKKQARHRSVPSKNTPETAAAPPSSGSLATLSPQTMGLLAPGSGFGHEEASAGESAGTDENRNRMKQRGRRPDDGPLGEADRGGFVP